MSVIVSGTRTDVKAKDKPKAEAPKKETKSRKKAE